MFIENYIRDSINIKKKILENANIISAIQNAAQLIIETCRNNKKVLIAGNGGSAADAQHIAGELVSKFYIDRTPLQAMALTTDTSVLTAIGNDYGFEKVFERQIQANANQGDVFIAISTSGNSKNIILALREAKNKGVKTIGLTGEKPCEMDNLCDILIKIPSTDTPKIQEAHITVEHIICAIVEKEIFGKQ